MRKLLSLIPNSGTSITTPSTFYEPPPTDENGSLSQSDAHDPDTDNIHLTTAFPMPTTSSTDSILLDAQVSLLPPVENPPEITNELAESNSEVAFVNNNDAQENVNANSLAGITL